MIGYDRITKKFIVMETTKMIHRNRKYGNTVSQFLIYYIYYISKIRVYIFVTDHVIGY